jgi:hypothetical protein
MERMVPTVFVFLRSAGSCDTYGLNSVVVVFAYHRLKAAVVGLAQIGLCAILLTAKHYRSKSVTKELRRGLLS